MERTLKFNADQQLLCENEERLDYSQKLRGECKGFGHNQFLSSKI